jgi:hypothetical protein
MAVPEELGTGCSIEPVADWDSKASLSTLQADLLVIAAHRVDSVKAIAQGDIDSESKSSSRTGSALG